MDRSICNCKEKRIFLMTLISFLFFTIFVSGCSNSKYTILDAEKRIASTSAAVSLGDTVFPDVGGKGCIAANWITIDDFSGVILEYDNSSNASQANQLLKNSIIAGNILLSSTLDYHKEIPRHIVSVFNKAFGIK